MRIRRVVVIVLHQSAVNGCHRIGFRKRVGCYGGGCDGGGCSRSSSSGGGVGIDGGDDGGKGIGIGYVIVRWKMVSFYGCARLLRIVLSYSAR